MSKPVVDSFVLPESMISSYAEYNFYNVIVYDDEESSEESSESFE